MKHVALFGSMAAVLSIGLSACESPDTDTRFDEFREEVDAVELLEEPDVNPNPAEPGFCDAEQVDISGTHFFALRQTLVPTFDLLFEVEVESTGSNVYDITFQPLASDFLPGGSAPRENAREPVGEPIVVTGVEVNANGEFEFELIGVEIAAESNGGTGGPISADLFNLQGRTCSGDRLCGEGVISVFSPIRSICDEEALANDECQRAFFGSVRLGEDEEIDADTPIRNDCFDVIQELESAE